MSSRNQQHHGTTLSLVGFGAAVGVGLATLAWYAGKKLANIRQREAPVESYGSASRDVSCQQASNEDDQSDQLLRQLRAYYENYVDIPDLSVIRHVVQDVRMEVFDYFRVHFPDLLLLDVLCQSDDLEGLHAVKIGDLDLLLVLGLDEYQWEIQKSAADDLSCYVSRTASGPSLALIDSCVVEGKLCATKVAESVFRDFAENFSVSDDNYQFRPVVNGSQVSLNVCGRYRSLLFNLMPAIRLRDVLLTAATSEAAGEENTWQESVFEREIQKLNRFDARYCCHLKCIQILKAIALDHPAEFGFLNPEIYKTIILELMGDDPGAWSHDNLADQFRSVLNMLVFYLAGKRAPHAVIPKMNLLQNASDEACNVLLDLISSCVAEDKIHTLLDK